MEASMRLPKLIGFALMVVVAACEPTVNGFGIIITPSGGANSGLLGFLEQPNATTAGSPIAPAVKIVVQDTLGTVRSEEHTSELQSHSDLVCRLLLEKKKISYRRARRRNQTSSGLSAAPAG